MVGSLEMCLWQNSLLLVKLSVSETGFKANEICCTKISDEIHNATSNLTRGLLFNVLSESSK